jgi:integrase
MATKATRPAGRLHLLTARQVQAAGLGEYADGGGLLLRVGESSCAWVLRYTAPAGRRREMGLGIARRGSVDQAGKTLVSARDMAHKAREQLRQGIDPIDARGLQRAAAQAAEEVRKVAASRDRWTLARSARDYHERVIEPTRTDKHGAQWIASLENHIPAALWNAPIDSIEPPALLLALLDIGPHERARNFTGETVPETVRRIRQRLDTVFEDAVFHKRCTSNPAAAIRRKMREASLKRDRGQFRAMAYRDAPAFMARLRAAEGVAARCLELTVLTAARTSETLLAQWGEFNLEAGEWLVPKSRMKAKESHMVFLSPRAIEVINSMRGLDETFVFPSTMPASKGKPMSNMAMLKVLDRLGARDQTTVHGLARATFSTWANETGAARPDVIEACLAHEEGNRVRASYNRAKFNEERAALLQAWADFLAHSAQVLNFKAA